MTILPTITTLEEFAKCITGASSNGSKFSMPNKGEFTYGQLVEKFASLIPGNPLSISTKKLAQSVFTDLTKLADAPANERMESIRKMLLFTAKEVTADAPVEVNNFFTALLPQLFKEDPSAAAHLIHNQGEAKAAAIVIPSGAVTSDGKGISLFELAERVYNWEERTGVEFDKRFTLEQHETNCFEIFEKRLAHFIEKGGAEGNRANREEAARRMREAYQKRENVSLDLRGLQLPLIPNVIEALPDLRRLLADDNAVLQNQRFIQQAHRDVVLDLIETNATHFQHISRELSEDESFVIEALKRNGAVLSYLPKVVSHDMVFLLRAAEQAPGIIAYIPDDLKKDDGLMHSLVNAAAFGMEKWEALFGAVGEVPSLPEGIVEILSSDDPFNPGKKVAETHMLFLVPATVNGEPLNLNSFRQLIKDNRGNKTDYRIIWDQIINEYGAASPRSAYWVLMTKDVIPDSRSQTFTEQKRMVEEKQGYEVCDLLSATVGILTHYARTGKCLFSDDPWTYTRCIEVIRNYRIVVGGFAPGGLYLNYYYHYYFVHNNVGVGGLRKFFRS